MNVSKWIRYGVTVSVVVFMIAVGSPLRAADVKLSIGFNSWFALWDPYWLAQKTNTLLTKTTEKVAPTFCYGPLLSLQLPKHFRIATMFQYAVFKSNTDGFAYAGSFTPIRESKRIVRYDNDTTFSYFFTKYFGMFIGFKYLQYQFVDESLQLLLNTPFFIQEKKRYREYCPSLGMSVIIPLYRPVFYLLFNVSVLYGYGMVRDQTRSFPIFLFGTNETPDIHKAGGNGTMTFAVYIEKASLTITAGFRYQVFKLFSRDGTVNQPISKAYEHFYGATMGLSYTLDFSALGKKKEGPQIVPEESR